jgi:hypothetical protein
MLMLGRLRTFGRIVLLVALLGGASVVAGVVAPTTAAAAQHCWYDAVRNPDGTISYVKKCRDVDPGEPGGPGGAVQDCGLEKMTPQPGYGAFFCVGTAPCTIKDNWVPYAPPTETAPPGQEWKLRLCWPCGGCLGPPVPTYVLDGPIARPLIVQAQEAFGNLRPPAGAVRHSPDARAVVRLPTWLWLDPGSFGELRGSSAEGLVAVAVPDGTSWRPGDGATVECAGAARRWTVHYENGGDTIDIPGAPLELTADTGFSMAVVETQIVTGGDGD